VSKTWKVCVKNVEGLCLRVQTCSVFVCAFVRLLIDFAALAKAGLFCSVFFFFLQFCYVIELFNESDVKYESR
jgi:hypothetical protein